MRLAALYCVWGDCGDLLSHSLNNISGSVDGIVIAYSETSNFGNHIVDDYDFYKGATTLTLSKVKEYKFEPNGHNAHQSECNKRNFALDKARQLGFTHFVMLDFDEFYERSEFEKEWKRIEQNDISGTVCRTKVYFKKPTLTVGFDHTLVPFIHKITPSLQFQLNSKTYPFAYDSAGNAHIDPTRRLNISSGVEWSDITMHHYSWLRSDYNLKIENSAARNNLKRSSIYSDLEKAAPGVYNEFYRAELQECDNIFNLPEL
jgi:hypothetical protein